MSDERKPVRQMADNWGLPRHQARIMGTRHMAASANYLAAQVAMQILEAGGNAIDAGTAGGIALGVIQCEFVHFAGVAPIIIYSAALDEVMTISGVGWWPKAASADYFRTHHGGRIPGGIKRTVVPAAPDAWISALERFGTMSFGDCAAAAIRYAEEGYPLSTLAAESHQGAEQACLGLPENARIFMPEGRPARASEIIIQKDLGSTLRYMAGEERSAAARGGRLAGLAAARHAFYRGDIANKIAEFHRLNDGWLTLEDLAEFRVEFEEPVRTRFKNIDVYACGPWCQGPVLSQTLNTLEGFDLKGLGHNTLEYVHILTEALKLSYADRDRYFGDPRFIPVPIVELLSKEYALGRAKMIDPTRAWPEMPPAGTIQELALAGENPNQLVAARSWTDPDPDTSHICVVDRHGNCFSATPSDGAIASPVIPGTGLVPSTRGVQSWTDPKHPSCLAPKKRPRLTPSPALVIKQGRWFMPFGSPGNDVQPQAMLQVFLNMFVFDMPPQAAIEQARFATYSYPRSSEPHDYYPGRITLESRLPESVTSGLTRLGHDVTMWPDYDWRAGCMSVVLYDRLRGVLEGGADPRRAGGVATL